MRLEATTDVRSVAETQWDAIVVGAGPAGAMTALHLARAGCVTLLVDRKTFPRAKACGGCLNAQALEALDRAGLGSDLARLGAVPFHGIRLRHRRRVVELRLPPGMAISRRVFDAMLVRGAIEAGAAFLPATAALVLPDVAASENRATRRVRLEIRHANRGRGSVVGHATQNASEGRQANALRHARELRHASEPRYAREPRHASELSHAGEWLGSFEVHPPIEARSRVVVVADGLGHPSLRECSLFRSQVVDGGRVGVSGLATGSSVSADPGKITMAIGRGGYAGIVEVEGGALNIAAAVDADWMKHCGGAAAGVASILNEAGVSADPTALAELDWMGTLPLTRHLPRPIDFRLFVIGDAAGYIEPFTGEGVSWALASAAAVTPFVYRGLKRWELALEEEWLVRHREIVRSRQRWCRLLARALRHPGLVRGLMAALHVHPGLASPVLAHLAPRAPLT